MIQYTHIVLASALESVLKPENRQDYYWGTIAADMRYLASMRREQTHLSARAVLEYAERYPHLRSFLQGYLVHCLSDKINLKDIVLCKFPLVLLKNKISNQQMVMIFEFYILENFKAVKQIIGNIMKCWLIWG